MVLPVREVVVALLLRRLGPFQQILQPAATKVLEVFDDWLARGLVKKVAP